MLSSLPGWWTFSLLELHCHLELGVHFAMARKSQMVLVWSTPGLPVPCTACLASVSQGADWSSRQGCAGSCFQHHGKDREQTVAKAHLFLGLPTPLCAAFPSEYSFLWHVFVLISCVCFFSRLKPLFEEKYIFLPFSQSYCRKNQSLGSCLWLASTGHNLRVQLGAPCVTDHSCSLSLSPCLLCIKHFFVNVL